MTSVFLIGSKQTDLEIFKYIDDIDIVNVCLVNKSLNKVLNDDKYWLQRFFYFYQKYLKDVNLKTYKMGKTWKQYYIDITRKLKNPYPYYTSAMAFTERRIDVLTLLENFYGIKSVRGVIARKGDTIQCYYTRNGEINGIKEGPCVRVALPEKNNKSVLNYYIVSKLSDRIEEYYNADIIQNSSEFVDHIKLSETIYENGDVLKVTKWNKKGVKIHEEIYDGTICNVTKWFVSGDIKSETHYDNGEKDGIWYYWNRNGEKTTKYFRDGKPVDYVSTAQERANDEAYLAELIQEENIDKFK